MDLSAAFQIHQRSLFGLAYRLLGRRSEAEDILQEAFIRGMAVNEKQVITNPIGLLRTIVTRLCLDFLRSPRARLEDYEDQWLPDMVFFQSDMSPEFKVERASHLSYGFLVLLELLTPEQRAVFVLREAYELDYSSIAKALGSTPASCRQIMKKARGKLDKSIYSTGNYPSPLSKNSLSRLRSLAAQFAKTCNTQGQTELIEMLSSDCCFRSDGGGVVKAARRPVYGVSKVTSMLLGLRNKYDLTLRATPQWLGRSILAKVERPLLSGNVAIEFNTKDEVEGVYFQWRPQKNPLF